MKKVKKLLSIILVVLMLCSAVPINGELTNLFGFDAKAVTYTYDMWQYEIVNGYARIVGYISKPKVNVIIMPQTLGGYPVKVVADLAAFNNSNILVFPHGLETIEGYAFNSSRLTAVVVPCTVKSIGQCAFVNCGMDAFYYEGTQAQYNSISFGLAPFGWQSHGVKNKYVNAEICKQYYDSYHLNVEIEPEFDSYYYINEQLTSVLGESTDSIKFDINVTNNSANTIKNIKIDLLSSLASFDSDVNIIEKTIEFDSIEPKSTRLMPIEIYPQKEEIPQIGLYGTVYLNDVEAKSIGKTVYIHYEIDRQTEVFSFNNSLENFVGENEDNKYLISSSAMAGVALHNKADMYLASSQKWEGSCHGISAMVAGFNYGLVTPEIFGATIVNDLSSPVDNIKLRDAINVLQCSQLTAHYIATVGLPSLAKTQKQLRKELVQAVSDNSHGGITPLVGIKEDGLLGASHAVVAYNIHKTENNYVISVTDPNDPQSLNTITISKDYENFWYSNSRYTQLKCVIDSSSHLDMNTYSSSLARTHIEEAIGENDFTVITATEFEVLTIKNKEGKCATVSYKDNSVEGDLELYVDTVAGGKGLVQIIVFDNADEVNEYTIESTTNNLDIIVSNNGIVASAKICDAMSATAFYSTAGEFRLSSLNNGEYTAYLSNSIKTAETGVFFTKVEGSNAEDIILTVVDNGVKIQSDNLSDSMGTLIKNDDALTEENFDFTSNAVSVSLDTNKEVVTEDIDIIKEITWVVDDEIISTEITVGEAIKVPDIPKKKGYIFVGWDKTIPDVMPEEDLTFIAQFKDCTCTCHKNPIVKLVFMIIDFIFSIFGSNFDCGCGISHY